MEALLDTFASDPVVILNRILERTKCLDDGKAMMLPSEEARFLELAKDLSLTRKESVMTAHLTGSCSLSDSIEHDLDEYIRSLDL